MIVDGFWCPHRGWWKPLAFRRSKLRRNVNAVNMSIPSPSMGSGWGCEHQRHARKPIHPHLGPPPSRGRGRFFCRLPADELLNHRLTAGGSSLTSWRANALLPRTPICACAGSLAFPMATGCARRLPMTLKSPRMPSPRRWRRSSRGAPKLKHVPQPDFRFDRRPQQK